MSDKKSVTVTIYGNEYTLKGEADPQYILELAKFVDAKMTEIGKKSSAPAAKVAILASMNISDELHRLEKMKSENLKLIETLERNLLDMKKSSEGSLKHTMEMKEHLEKNKSEADQTRAIVEQAEKERERLRDELAEAKEKINRFEEEAMDYKQELETLKPELEEIRKKLTEESKKNNSIQEEIKETQGQLEKAQIELTRKPVAKDHSQDHALPEEKLAALFRKMDAILE
jgi:cell division protein ZapA